MSFPAFCFIEAFISVDSILIQYPFNTILGTIFHAQIIPKKAALKKPSKRVIHREGNE